jgi:ATP-dependent DNA helicase Rep
MGTNLNSQQKEAVQHTSGPLLVIAGAGSGKTRVIIEKIAYLIQEKKIPAKNIYAISFTNKAGQELRQRAKNILGDFSNGLHISTFHALGIEILRKEHEKAGYKKNFSIIDAEDINQILADIVGYSDNNMINSIAYKISKWKNSCISIENLEKLITDITDLDHFKIYKQYIERLKTYQIMDFDDLLAIPVHILTHNPDIKYKWQNKIQYLMVDEYQDTNSAQYHLLKLLRQSYPNFTVVGDDDQSIYSWRGANADNLNSLQKDFPNLTVIKFEQNYRSTNSILQTANKLIGNNIKIFHKQLWSELGIGSPIQVLAVNNEEEMINTVLRKISTHHLQNSTDYNDYAILYRSNHQARILELALQNKNMPYNISGGQSFFSSSEIKDIIAYLRLIINNDDDMAFLRIINIPKRNIGISTIKQLVEYATSRRLPLFAAIDEAGFAEICNNIQLNILINFQMFIKDISLHQDNVSDTIKYLLQAIDYEHYLYQTVDKAEKKWDNVIKFTSWIVKKSIEDNKTLANIIQNIMLVSVLSNNEDNTTIGINLSTIHAAKGLEYKYVYIIDCEEGILPHQESINNDTNGDTIAEERRLMYVAITRAKYELTILYCLNRKKQGELMSVSPSRFIKEMDNPHLIDQTKEQNQIITDTQAINDKFALLKNRLKKCNH